MIIINTANGFHGIEMAILFKSILVRRPVSYLNLFNK